ncbi:MAG: hypothetical protein M9899_04970 [Bdellovibrionaceae bacterium]|nr:hypothetical protein [Pseudobdellovibrionaceae bacterium]
MTQSQVRIAVMQMTSSNDVKRNQEWILHQLEAMPNDIRLVFFPENALSITIAPDDKPKAFTFEDDFFQQLQKRCLVGGYQIHFCTPIQKPDGVYSSSFWVTSEGIQDVYDKNHLFKVKLPQLDIDEGRQFKAGEQSVIHAYKDWKIGSSICYDIRFSYHFLNYALQNVDIITVPAAFTVRTGRDHWETLLRARAIENQCYIIAAAQTGTHVCPKTGAERQSHGQSLVIDAWGNILLDAGKPSGAFYCYLDKDIIQKTKQVLPLARRERA